MNRYRFDDKKHLHLLDNKPLSGTSSIVNVLAKNLTWWSAELSAVACLEVGDHIPTIREEYLLACSQSDKKKAIDALQKKYPIFKKARFAHYEDKNKKADKGIDLHADLESWIKYQMGFCDVPAQNERIRPFVEWSQKNVKRFIWSEGYCYSDVMWVGGISDFGCILNDDSICLGDFKSSRTAFLSHFLQGAGYTIQMEESGVLDKNGNKIYELTKPISSLVVVPFGAEKVEPVFNSVPLGDLKIAFKGLIPAYKLLQQE